VLRAVLILGAFTVATAAGAVEERVLQAIQQARRAAGVPAFTQRADLDAIARDHARRIAALPHARRLAESDSFAAELRRAGIHFRRVDRHLDLNRGYTDPAAAFVDDWRSYRPAWTSAVDGELDAIGIATARAEDGWIVLVAVLIEERPPPVEPVPEELEARALEAANEARARLDLAPLTLNRELLEVARAHSRDMVRSGFFHHREPGGRVPADRVRAGGIRYKRVGENIHRSRGTDDPVATAISGWLDSPGHRGLLLSPEFSESAVGVAVAGDGTVYFTQLFLEPAR
jgi:uncharacterized protein YkwD